MKLEISREECLRLAKAEGDSEVGAGALALDPDIVIIDYTNYRGERGLRAIRPMQVSFGCNEWHKEPQWLLDAVDLEKNAVRSFAMRSIHSWGGVSIEEDRAITERATRDHDALVLTRMRSKLSDALNSVLCEMKGGYDDSIVGFNEAWDVMRKAFDREIDRIAGPL